MCMIHLMKSVTAIRKSVINNTESEKRLRQLMELEETELDVLLSTDLTDNERIDAVAVRILKKHRRVFEELAK